MIVKIQMHEQSMLSSLSFKWCCCNDTVSLILFQWCCSNNLFLVIGLFHRVMMQSGVPTSFWSVYNETIDLTMFTTTIADKLKCKQLKMEDRIDCLRKIDFRRFIDLHWKVNLSDTLPSKLLNNQPSTELQILFF